MTYAEKLKDPRWQKMRLTILNRDEFRCVNCGDDDKTLNVHHLFYKKNCDPWDYPETSLITLCNNCHEYAGELDIKGFILEYVFRAYDYELLMRFISYQELIPNVSEYNGDVNAYYSDIIGHYYDPFKKIKLIFNHV